MRWRLEADAVNRGRTCIAGPVKLHADRAATIDIGYRMIELMDGKRNLRTCQKNQQQAGDEIPPLAYLAL